MAKDKGLMTTVRRTIIWLVACVVVVGALYGGWTYYQQQSGGSSGEPQVTGGPPMVRRLTEAEYRATIADVFAPDIKIVGRFEHPLRSDGLLAVGTSEAGISPFAVEQYDASANAISAEVVSKERRDQFIPCKPQSETAFDQACAKQFIDHYGLLLFRRPLTDDEANRFIEVARSGQERLGNFYDGLGYALTGMLVSPQFLLRIETTEPDPKHAGQVRLDAYSRATRLSYFLTGSTPDEELLRAAGAGELDTKDGLTKQVDRLIASPRFKGAVRTFFKDMLQYDQFSELSKDPVIYPAFNSVVSADAEEQTMQTIVDLLVTQKGDYRDLFTTRETFLTRALGIVYRMPVRTRNGWERAEYPASSHRGGIQTNIAFLALHAHPGRSSATRRGVAIREIFLCQQVPDPPANVNFAVVQDTSNTKMPTARDRLLAHRTEPTCAGCHQIMDPIGLTLENFDGAGAYRATENGAKIDSSGTLDGQEFGSVEGLGQALHDHPDTPRCLVSTMYRSAVGRDTTEAEAPYLDYLNQTFAADGYNVPDLMRAIALSRTFYKVSEPTDDKGASSESAALESGSGDKS